MDKPEMPLLASQAFLRENLAAAGARLSPWRDAASYKADLRPATG
jgi:hypothetical protein